MYSLYIDTHNENINIVLFQDEKPVVIREKVGNHNHSQLAFSTLIEVLNSQKIDVNELKEIIVVNGPGSFTSIRIGVTIAKTLAYSLKIPIKVLSSLQIKAISFSHENVIIKESEKNGAFLGTFDKNNQLIDSYVYLRNEELKNRQEIYIEDVKIDYEKIYFYAKSLESVSPHSVNPLYVKKIEVEHD